MKLTKKALIVTTVSGFVPQFEMSNVRILQGMGYEVHYASNYHTPSYGNDNERLNGTGIIQHQIDFIRNPFKFKNINIYFQLKQLMEMEHFDLVHCHTPMGGVMARLAAHATNTAPVIYTAHGFHFFKGSSIISWLCYYPMEKFLSRFTDVQICINKEDYEIAQKHFHAKYVKYIPGVGIDNQNVKEGLDKKVKKTELGVPLNKTILLSSGELIKRKNHETIIRVIAALKKKYPDSCTEYHYIICGHGALKNYLLQLAEQLHVSNCISFLGYRKDMMEIYQLSDLFIFPSYQEGLPMALLEAMTYGLPVICSDIRGSRDLMGRSAKQSVEYCDGGFLVKRADDVVAYGEAIMLMLNDREQMYKMGIWNKERISNFSSLNVDIKMKDIYSSLIM